MSLTPELFQAFSNLAYAQSGIRLREGKEALILARISKRMRVLELKTPQEYFEFVQSDSSGNELIEFLDVISTNFTHFFREESHFQYLTELVRQRVHEGAKRLRFWSAACSTGEEPYTMALSIAEALGPQVEQIDWRVLATDISTRVLSQAASGVYDDDAVERIPKALQRKYFTSARGGKDKDKVVYRVREILRKRVVFKRMNLAALPYPMTGPLDVIFCRNVMIYFDAPVRKGLIEEISRLLGPHGLVCIGHSETLSGHDHDFSVVEPSVYVRANQTKVWPHSCKSGVSAQRVVG